MPGFGTQCITSTSPHQSEADFYVFFLKLFFHDSLEKDVGIYRNPHEQAII